MWTKTTLGVSTVKKLTMMKDDYEISFFCDSVNPDIYAVSLYNTACCKSLMSTNLDFEAACNALQCLGITDVELKQLYKLI